MIHHGVLRWGNSRYGETKVRKNVVGSVNCRSFQGWGTVGVQQQEGMIRKYRCNIKGLAPFLTAFKPHHFFAPCVPHLGKLIRKPSCSLLWCPWEVQSIQEPVHARDAWPCPHTPIPNTINPKKVSFLCSLKSYSDQLGDWPALLRKLLYMCNKIFHTLKKLIHL